MQTIVTFFTGIMLFFSGLFGTTPHQVVVTPSVTDSTSTQVVQTSATTSLSMPQVASSSQNFKTNVTGSQRYHDNQYNFEIQYPSFLEVRANIGDIYLSDRTKTNEDGLQKIIMGVDVIKAKSLQSWFQENIAPIYKTKGGPSSYEVITINGLEAWDLHFEVSQGFCSRRVAIYHNGMVFDIGGGASCDYDNAIINSIIASFTFSNKEDDRVFKTIDVIKSSNTTVIHNDPLATLKNDFKENSQLAQAVYTTKDKTRTYFTLHVLDGEKVEGVLPDCQLLNYLDIVKQKYHNTNVEYCPGAASDKELQENLPFVVQYNKFDLKSLYALNLETLVEKLLYTKNNNESLAVRCTEFGNYEDYRYIPTTSYLGNKKISISVYKEVGQDTKPCTKETIGKYEKIRDDIIDLNKF